MSDAPSPREAQAHQRCRHAVLPLQLLFLVLVLPTVRACNNTLSPLDLARELGGVHALLLLLTFGALGILAATVMLGSRRGSAPGDRANGLSAGAVFAMLTGSAAHLVLRLLGAALPPNPTPAAERPSQLQWLLAHRAALLYECLSVALLALAARALLRSRDELGWARTYGLARACALALPASYVSAMLVRWASERGVREGLASGAAVWLLGLLVLPAALRLSSPLPDAEAQA